VKNPGRTIPRAVIISVLVIGALYVTMNLAIIGVVPWEKASKSENIAAEFMETLFGRRTADIFTWFIVWTAIASLFAGTLGYSRIPYAAARAGDFFRAFARVHPRKHYPYVSLLSFGALTAVFCFFPLQTVIDAAVSIRILIQFVGQIAALHIVRTTRRDVVLPFRMWLYPLPSLIALAGWLFIFATTARNDMLVGLGVLVLGCVVCVLRGTLRKRGVMGN
jgi:amino acid transporter